MHDVSSVSQAGRIMRTISTAGGIETESTKSEAGSDQMSNRFSSTEHLKLRLGGGTRQF